MNTAFTLQTRTDNDKAYALFYDEDKGLLLQIAGPLTIDAYDAIIDQPSRMRDLPFFPVPDWAREDGIWNDPEADY